MVGSDSRGDECLHSLRERIAIEEAKLHLEFLQAARMADTSEVKRRAFGWLAELFAHDYGEVLRMRRAVAAQGNNLPPEDFSRPYPSPSSSTVTNTQGGPGGSLVAIALASGLGGAGLAAVLALQSLLSKPHPAPQPLPQSPVIQQPADVGEQRYRVKVYWGDQEIGPDGKQATVP